MLLLFKLSNTINLNHLKKICIPLLCVYSGFDDQISGNKDLADAAIRKLPAINATMQKAIADNIKTQDILDAMSTHYRDAQDTINTLTSTATKLEVWRPVTFVLTHFI